MAACAHGSGRVDGMKMKTTLPRSRWLRRFGLLLAAAFLGCAPSAAQAQTAPDDADDGGRGIIPVFPNARSQSGGSGTTAMAAGSGTTAMAAPVYRRIARPPKQKPSSKARQRNQSVEKTGEPIMTRGQNPARVKQGSAPQASGAVRPNNAPAIKRPTIALDAARNLGVTIWKLQPERAFADYNQPACRGGLARSAEQNGGRDLGQPTMLAPPIRSSSETLFHLGDRIRLSIESTRPGYLYIIHRELQADRTYGPPKLLFPTGRIRGGNNYLAPGSPVEFPDLCDNANYFEFLPARGAQSPLAEALIMIVSDKPLAEIGAPRDALAIPESWLATWEARWSSSRASVYELDEGEGQPYTSGELNAGFEIRRQGRPGARALGQSGPQPQTLYSVDTRGDGMMATVLLWYE
jgi:hypothetical protein